MTPETKIAIVFPFDSQCFNSLKKQNSRQKKINNVAKRGLAREGFCEMKIDTKKLNRKEPQELITKREVAQRLRISTRKIELDRHFPAIRFGRTIRYSWPDVLEYLKSHSK